MKFLETVNEAEDLINSLENHEKNLQAKGFVMMDGDIGYAKSRSYLFSSPSYYYSDPKDSNIITKTAKLIAARNQSDLSSFQDHATCFGRSNHARNSHTKYRSIDGYGNNLKNPEKILTGERRERQWEDSGGKDTTTEFTRSGKASPAPTCRVPDESFKMF